MDWGERGEKNYFFITESVRNTVLVGVAGNEYIFLIKLPHLLIYKVYFILGLTRTA